MSAPSSRLIHPGVDPRCPTCKGYAAIVRAVGERAVARLCTCVGVCPLCRGDGFVSRGEGAQRRMGRCRCRLFARRLEMFDEVGIPGRHADSTLVSFEPDKAQMACFQAVNRYVAEFRPGEENRGFVLHGEVGRGKTHLMVAVLRELVLRHGVTARFVEFSHLLADLKSGFDRGEGAGSLIGPLVGADVLAIDEMGKGRNTEFEGTVLDELISRRYNARGTILATTNYPPKVATGRRVANNAAPEESRPALVDRVGDRVFSRLREMCDFWEMTGEDFRDRRLRRR